MRGTLSVRPRVCSILLVLLEGIEYLQRQLFELENVLY
jgi:hypothetical protein